ncbi:DUF5063 domain-containing protein [Thermochromatium tepidum]|uniref:DUF5063 domain-containing protein n=1 Tax=Thermochromatium tepidum ATCC 43061 TaxID=316276 RepID=A0A6I6E1Y4_THETI|nr:DUF5063 domain-containing protein [Thermochromatium tepidum]QGU33904.1 DUF5063 domain-containing protein [Thermochromatium tepidum ATCC 43061]
MDAIISPTRGLETGFDQDLARLARRYCELIENRATQRGVWLARIAELLPRLHAGISSLDATELPPGEPLEPVDLDARFELFSQLRRLLADRDAYWLEFDSVDDGMTAMTGSLADDLTDIYYELKQGLRLFESDPERAVATWASGYRQHWGQHLVDAERHLAMLRSQSRLDL